MILGPLGTRIFTRGLASVDLYVATPLVCMHVDVAWILARVGKSNRLRFCQNDEGEIARSAFKLNL